ncbi:winged helix-turn-helix domain-containing protein [Pontimicrobium aquaticum]|uniref:LysR family transcriptional regulator n=1 Tax=Pontimicrobium aquaticum TaxID=2565367 RepID=A0A4U0ESG0_9FLAO|nr:LysR family transcriptional regulator [Pontimicrobium aquaticum]TJY34650.1 LysR family transcriptional regulator [Pontimicrobium aquaticum]
MKYKIKSRIWIEADDNVLLGEGRVALLKAIEETGSLSKAAKSLKMSYKKAWSLIDALNSRAQKQVVITSIGGKGGGGAKLTPYGKNLIDAFDTINQNCWAFLDKEMKKQLYHDF